MGEFGLGRLKLGESWQTTKNDRLPHGTGQLSGT
jgi:hypothetical protein